MYPTASARSDMRVEATRRDGLFEAGDGKGRIAIEGIVITSTLILLPEARTQ